MGGILSRCVLRALEVGGNALHWQMLLCGVGGGALVSLVTLYRYVQLKSQWPWKVKNGPTIPMWVTVELIRIVLGGGVAWGLAATGQLGVLGAIMVGAGAPAIIDKWQLAAPRVAASVQANQNNPSQVGDGSASSGANIAASPSAVSEGGV